MRARYEFKVNEGFYKGDCWDCPLTETIEDADGGWDEFCIVKASFSDECPLELIDEGENDER